MKKKFFAITICYLLAGCGVSPDAQHYKHTNQTGQAPCNPDTVYVEVGSSAWWGVLPAEKPGDLPDYPAIQDTLDQFGEPWYWHTVNDTVKLPARVMMRHTWPAPDTVRDTIPNVIYRDSAGIWHMVADSLAKEIAFLEAYRKRSHSLTLTTLAILALSLCGFLTWHYINYKNTFKRERATE